MSLLMAPVEAILAESNGRSDEGIDGNANGGGTVVGSTLWDVGSDE